VLRFDPHAVPVIGIDDRLPAVPAERQSPAALRERFRRPPAWEPEIHVERRFTDRPPADASVLVPLVLRDELAVLLTMRTDHLNDHPGQISFPGGRAEPSDHDAIATALREAHEEIGLEAQFIDVIGAMPTYTTGSGFVVTPVVALVRPGFVLHADPFEVADVFEVPLRFLMDPANHRRHAIEFDGARREYFSMPWQATGDEDAPREYFIWGATAAMLRNLYRFLIA
jgi:8-oxo-dGTP pyrophosphatase MutT (NUDIX family)